MPIQNVGMQPSPELVWDMNVATDGTWSAVISTSDAKIGQRTELLQIGEIRQENITVTPITGCEIFILEAFWAGRDNQGVGAGDGCYVTDLLGTGSELNDRDTAAAPFTWLPPTGSLFGQNWCIFAESLVDGLMIVSVNSSVAQLAPLTIPTRKLNKPCNIVDDVLGSSDMELIPPDIIRRDAGDFTTEVKVRDDVLVRMNNPTLYPNIHGRVKAVTASDITLYAPHNQDTGGVVQGSMVVSAQSDGT